MVGLTFRWTVLDSSASGTKTKTKTSVRISNKAGRRRTNKRVIRFTNKVRFMNHFQMRTRYRNVNNIRSRDIYRNRRTGTNRRRTSSMDYRCNRWHRRRRNKGEAEAGTTEESHCFLFLHWVKRMKSLFFLAGDLFFFFFFNIPSLVDLPVSGKTGTDEVEVEEAGVLDEHFGEIPEGVQVMFKWIFDSDLFKE